MDVTVLIAVIGCAGVDDVVVVMVVLVDIIMGGVIVISVLNAVELDGVVFASGFDAINMLISFRRFEWKSNCASAVIRAPNGFFFFLN